MIAIVTDKAQCGQRDRQGFWELTEKRVGYMQWKWIHGNMDIR